MISLVLAVAPVVVHFVLGVIIGVVVGGRVFGARVYTIKRNDG